MDVMVGGIALKALTLCGILFLVARHEADFEWSKVVLVTCGITLGNVFLELFLVPALAEYMPYLVATAVTFLVAIAFMTFMLTHFCWVRLWKGVLVTILFMGFNMGLSWIGVIVTAKIDPFTEKSGGANIEQNHQETLQEFQENQSSSQMTRGAKAEDRMPLPRSGAPNEEEATTSLVTLSQSEIVAPPESESREPPTAEEPVDELPAFANTPEWRLAQAKIKVSAVLVERDGRNTAIVNGKVLGIGDVLTVQVKRKSYRFKMAEITTDWVAWDPLEETNPN
jgi:hypothetical protein